MSTSGENPSLVLKGKEKGKKKKDQQAKLAIEQQRTPSVTNIPSDMNEM